MASALTAADGHLEFVCGKGEAIVWAGVHRVSPLDPTPVDISGWTGLVTVRNADGTTAFTKPITVTNGPKGQYTWPVLTADTNISAVARQLDIWRTDVGAETEMGAGTLVITPNAKYGN